MSFLQVFHVIGNFSGSAGRSVSAVGATLPSAAFAGEFTGLVYIPVTRAEKSGYNAQNV